MLQVRLFSGKLLRLGVMCSRLLSILVSLKGMVNFTAQVRLFVLLVLRLCLILTKLLGNISSSMKLIAVCLIGRLSYASKNPLLILGGLLIGVIIMGNSRLGRHVNFLTLTYVEDRERIDHLAQLLLSGQNHVCWCVHDKDTLQDGSPDKVHCHAVVHLDNAMTLSAFSSRFHIRERMIQPCRKGDEIGDLDSAFLYLIHADRKSRSEHKYQYPLTSVVGPWESYVRQRITELLNKSSNSAQKEADSFLTVQAYIEGNLYMTMSEVARWAASNGHWAAFRRSSSIFRDIIKEHNDYLRQLDIKRDRARWEEELEHRADESSVYEAVGYRALRTLDLLLEQAGRPSVKLKNQIRYVDEVVAKTGGKVNVELIKEMLRDGQTQIEEGQKESVG